MEFCLRFVNRNIKTQIKIWIQLNIYGRGLKVSNTSERKLTLTSGMAACPSKNVKEASSWPTYCAKASIVYHGRAILQEWESQDSKDEPASRETPAGAAQHAHEAVGLSLSLSLTVR